MRAVAAYDEGLIGDARVSENAPSIFSRFGGELPRPRTGRVLFLQGLGSPFFNALAGRLSKAGCDCRMIRFNAGGSLFWSHGGVTDFRQPLEEWESFLQTYLTANDVTDIVLVNDCWSYHRIAVKVARRLNRTLHIFEDGYIRPNWLTLEHAGINGFSTLPRTMDGFIARAEAIGELPEEQDIRHSFFHRALWDVAMNAMTLAGRWRFPHYRHHRPYHPLAEAKGWIVKGMRVARRRRDANQVVKHLLASDRAFYIAILQLDSDSQLRIHSPFSSSQEFLERTIASFADHAPADAQLIVKVHPLDNGLIDRFSQSAEIAARHGVGDRVRVIEGGSLPAMLKKARGTVVVNSTVGVSSLHHKCPTIALGTALYNLDGLTFQGSLNDFWTRSSVPDPSLYRIFRNVVIHDTQINGGFFSREAIEHAAEGATRRILQRKEEVVARGAGTLVGEGSSLRLAGLAMAQPMALRSDII